MGRPSDYNQETVTILCEQLSQGMSLRKICEQENMPDKATVLRWLAIHPGFRDQYAQAREIGIDTWAESLDEIADDIPSVIVGDDKSDSARVQAEKIRLDTKRWLMSKMKPKKYGDKIDMTTNGKDLPIPIYNSSSVNKDANGANQV